MSDYDDHEDEDVLNIDIATLEKECEENTKKFSTLIDSLSSLHDKKKELWKQIYANATLDRRNSMIMFRDLYQAVHGNPEQHTMNGSILAKYMERMNKANEQLIKLAEILDDAVELDEEVLEDEDAIYENLQNLHAEKRQD